MFDVANAMAQKLEPVQPLDSRRPRFLADVVGQGHIIKRIKNSLANGTLPQLLAFIGPTGSGKTTLAQILARLHFCPHSARLGDCCGDCRTCCLEDLSSTIEFTEWTGAELEDSWTWWIGNGRHAVEKPDWFFFLDEAQDLSKLHQKALLRKLESSNARVAIATTHKHEIVDALLNRFGANVYEVKRPTLDETLIHMAKLCVNLNVSATTDQLAQAAAAYALDLRLCTDFVYTAAAQTEDGIVTDEFIAMVLGIDKCSQRPTDIPSQGFEL